jgi:formate dehydrogenase maturation protein FdhE
MKSIDTEADPVPHLAGFSITSCPACGSRDVTAAVAPPGQRERAVYLRCGGCGRERDDLDFYEA